MSIEQNKATVLQFYQAFDNRNIDQALALLAPNFVAHLAGIPQPLDRQDLRKSIFEPPSIGRSRLAPLLYFVSMRKS
jgi:ketosteroid isomerase-like protein